jgi:hypothetical protein
MKKTMLFLLFLAALGLSLTAMTCGDDDDDDNDVSETCDIDVLQAQASDTCGGDARYTGTADSDDACSATCESGETPYWYSQYGACNNECFCCGLVS